MDLNYLLSAAFMIVILAILFVQAFPTIKEKKSRLRCLLLIAATAIYVLLDLAFVATSLWKECPTWLFRVAAFFFYLSYVSLPFAWHLYVRNFIGRSYPKVVKYLELIPLAFLLVLVLTNPFTHVLYEIKDGGGAEGYIRGPWFTLYAWLNFFYYLEPLIDLLVIAILMDVRMPVMNGIETTKAIRALDRPDSKIVPIIAMTADAFDDERKRTLESGMNYHLSKPVDAKDLIETLGKCWANFKKNGLEQETINV